MSIQVEISFLYVGFFFLSNQFSNLLIYQPFLCSVLLITILIFIIFHLLLTLSFPYPSSKLLLG